MTYSDTRRKENEAGSPKHRDTIGYNSKNKIQEDLGSAYSDFSSVVLNV